MSSASALNTRRGARSTQHQARSTRSIAGLPATALLRNIDRWCPPPDTSQYADTRGRTMSKSSTVTMRERPVADVAGAQAGGLTIHGETLVVQTDQRIEL